MKHSLTFISESHSYLLDGNPIISVTQLLTKHGIAPYLGNANPLRLQYKAQRGTLIHLEIEDFVNSNVLGFSPEVQHFAQEIFPLCDFWSSEVQLYCDDYAGTCDLIGIKDCGDYAELWIVDTKTGHVDKNYVRWQTTLYGKAYDFCKVYVRWQTTLYGKAYDFCKVLKKPYKKRFFCFDAKPDKSTLIELNPVADEDVESLLKAERNGEIYQPRTLTLGGGLEDRLLDVEQYIASMEAEIKAVKAERQKMFDEILSAFEKQGVKEFKSENMVITYVAPYSRESVDSERLKKEYADIYKECLKTTNVKASLRVKIKEEN